MHWGLLLALLLSCTVAHAAAVEIALLQQPAPDIAALRAAPESAWQAKDVVRRQAAGPSDWRLQLGADRPEGDVVLVLKETYDAQLTVWLPPDYQPQSAGTFDPNWHQIGSRHRLTLLLPAEVAHLPVYLRHAGGRHQPIPVSVEALAHYVAQDLNRVRFTNAVLAALLLLGVVATVYAVALRRWLLLLFCVWVASCTLYVAVMSGEIAALLPWPGLLPYALRASSAGINIGIVVVYAFTIGFLELGRYYPRLARAMQLLVACAALLAVLVVVMPNSILPSQGMNLVSLALAAIALGAAAARARAGSVQGWFYLIGWGGLTLVSVARVWWFLNLRGTPPLLEWLHPLAYVAGALALVLATARAARYAEREMHAARHVARIDPLTHLPNRLDMDQGLALLIRQARDELAPLSLMFLDLDRFKTINDRHGHAVGDACLAAVGTILRHHVRASDLIARYGGEEFVLALEGAGRERALEAAEALRAAVQAEAVIVDGARVDLTVSIGLSELRPQDTAADLLARADAALYRAKQHGRNRVEADFAD